jgi:hypothetical protein
MKVQAIPGRRRYSGPDQAAGPAEIITFRTRLAALRQKSLDLFAALR